MGQVDRQHRILEHMFCILRSLVNPQFNQMNTVLCIPQYKFGTEPKHQKQIKSTTQNMVQNKKNQLLDVALYYFKY